MRRASSPCHRPAKQFHSVAALSVPKRIWAINAAAGQGCAILFEADAMLIYSAQIHSLACRVFAVAVLRISSLFSSGSVPSQRSFSMALQMAQVN